jgi:hypothetical protein
VRGECRFGHRDKRRHANISGLPPKPSDTTLTWSLSVTTAATRKPSAAVRALLDLVDEQVRETAAQDL